MRREAQRGLPAFQLSCEIVFEFEEVETDPSFLAGAEGVSVRNAKREEQTKCWIN